jgi:thiol-disulfide isomerase/thioredoxin
MIFEQKNSKWILLPACLFLGLALLVTFVSISQDYLSEYLVQNSKNHLGKLLDRQKLSTLLKAPEISDNSKKMVLVFWSVSCAPCLEKLKDLPDLGREDRIVLPINTDPEESAELAQKLLKASLPGQRFLRDSEKVLVTELEIDYLPTNVFLSADGTIEKIEIGQK